MKRIIRDKLLLMLNMLLEVSSISSIARIVGVNYITVQKLMLDSVQVCKIFHHKTVMDEDAKQIQCDKYGTSFRTRSNAVWT